MGKTAPAKQKGSISAHSRAARRATSPSINTDKSLKEVSPPTESAKTYRPSILAAHQGAGVTKKSKNGRKSTMSAKAKRRHEKGMDRAEAVMDRKSVKVEKSKGKARTVQERAKNWEELNKKFGEKKKAALEKENLSVDEDEDEEEEVVMDDAVGTVGKDANLPPQSIPLPKPVEDEEEVL